MAEGSGCDRVGTDKADLYLAVQLARNGGIDTLQVSPAGSECIGSATVRRDLLEGRRIRVAAQPDREYRDVLTACGINDIGLGVLAAVFYPIGDRDDRGSPFDTG